MSGNSRVCHCGAPVVGRRLCRKHYQQAWKAGQFTNQPLPPRVPGRTICPEGHGHDASSTCYIQHQCRCVPCKELHSRMEQRRERLKAYGRFDTGLVDVEPVREHMMMLAEFGLGYKRVAGVAGIGVTAARTIIWGRQDGTRKGELQKRVKRETAEAILAVKPDISMLAGGAVIPSRGVQRRAQALCTRGWSVSRVGAEIGMAPANFWKVMQHDTVTVATHRAVAAVFDKWWNLTPPRETHWQKAAYGRAVNFAKARRWLAPLAWDDIDNDPEPPVQEEGVVDELAAELALAGERVRLTKEERLYAVRKAHADGWGRTRTGEALRMSGDSVRTMWRQLGLEERSAA